MVRFLRPVVIFILLSIKEVELCVYRKEDGLLDCSRCNYVDVPHLTLKIYIDDIREINLSHNNINKLTESSFKGFSKLRVLRLSHNNITSGYLKAKTFADMKGLRSLFLDHNNLNTVPELSHLVQLKKLVLDGNKITRILVNGFQTLRRMQYLSMNNNTIQFIASNAFTGLEQKLSFLSLQGNKLKRIPSRAIKKLRKLSYLDIRKNKITLIQKDAFRDMSSLRKIQIFDETPLSKKEDKEADIRVNTHAFRHMRSLIELRLHDYNAKLDAFPNLEGTNNIRKLSLWNINNLQIPSQFCKQKKKLESISVGYCNLTKFPTLNKCFLLHTIDFVANNINEIPANAFSGLKLITNMEILRNQNKIEKIDVNAFSNLPSLVELDLSYFNLASFPNLNGTNSLRKLKLRHCGITHIPSHICYNLPRLANLDLAMNEIKVLPNLSQCEDLKHIDLYNNKIIIIDRQFANLAKLETVSLSDNHIKKISETAFNSSLMTSLLLDRNMLEGIEENTFKYTRNLRTLNVAYNNLQFFPRKYLQSIYEINIAGNKQLERFLTQEDMPHARRLTLVYNYHCCFFMRKMQQINHEISAKILSSKSKWKTLNDDKELLNQPYVNMSDNAVGMHNIEPLLKWLNNETKLYFNNPKEGVERNHDAIQNFDTDAFCTPLPNEFYPCDDLMGKQWLRICVWIVFLLAVFGNIVVLIVLTVNCGKLDVPRYLIINLAFSDLCLGIYLGFLALVDIITLGDFRSYALQWQFSSSCQVAGFLAVFSSELSVYTLAVITIERFTTIKHSMHVERRMTKNQAAIVMAIGWVFSTCLAILPLNIFGGIKFSDYSKYSVCLPFEQDELSSKIYLVFLLVFNLVAFTIILGCYIQIYLFIRGSNAWNSGDSRIARRMAILVATDFLCWFPICITALSAVFGSSILTDVWMSKVLTVFIFPLNACANPFLYAILTKQFRKDVVTLVRSIKEQSVHRKKLTKSLLKLPRKGSLTYSTSVRRGSSCSFLFSRRYSSKTDDIKTTSRAMTLFQEPDEDIPDNDYNEMLTSV